MDGISEARRRRIVGPLDSWRACDRWAALVLFIVWGVLATGAAALRVYVVWVDGSGAPTNGPAVLAQLVGGWSPAVLLTGTSVVAVLLRRRATSLSWLPACGVVLVFVLWSIGAAIGRLAHTG